MNEDFYISLIYKQLTGSLKEDEKVQLQDWIKASDVNKQTAEHISIAWKQTANLSAKPEVNIDAAFETFTSRIEQDDSEKINSKTHHLPRERKKTSLNWLKIAAGLLFIIVAGFALKSYFGAPSTEITFVEFRTEEKTEVVTLPDNSTVKLNKNSYLKYPTQFLDEDRNVSLEGEAFFDVTHNPAAPFIVETSAGTVQVLGTSFNVRAYPGESTQHVQVATGKVKVRIESTKEEVILTKGDQAVYDKEKSNLEKLEEASENNLSWYTGQLVFKNTLMTEVVKDIEAFYQVDLEIENEAIADCGFNSTFKNASLELVIETISLALKAEIEKENNRYVLKGGQCE